MTDSLPSENRPTSAEVYRDICPVCQTVHAPPMCQAPATYYAFLIQRPQDKEAWPTIFQDRARAEAYPCRSSDVVEVVFNG